MLPFDFAPQCEVMLLTVSAAALPLRRSDLGCAKQLKFTVVVREKGTREESKVGAFFASVPTNFTGSVLQRLMLWGIYL